MIGLVLGSPVARSLMLVGVALTVFLIWHNNELREARKTVRNEIALHHQEVNHDLQKGLIDTREAARRCFSNGHRWLPASVECVPRPEIERGTGGT